MIGVKGGTCVMYCPHCGTATRDHHAYCHACGGVLRGARRWTVAEAPASGLRRIVEVPGGRAAIYAVGGLVAMLLIAEVVRAVVALALPLLVVLLLMYWARERRRRYY